MHCLARSPARLVMLGAIGIALAACGSDSTSPHPAPASVTVTPPTNALVTGDSVQLAATAKDANGNDISNATFTWTSSDSGVAPVSASGMVSAFLPGSATITATSGGVSGDAQVTIDAGASVQLHEGILVGTPHFDNGSTASGGTGAPVDGIPCGQGHDAEHYHAHLALFANGQQIAIPAAIGIDSAFFRGDSLAIAGKCFYWLHTHDRSGIVHVEPEETGHTFTLGQFFDVWGEPLSTDGAAGFSGPVAVYVDGQQYTGDPRALVLKAHQQITLEVGTPRVAPPIYAFPSGY